MFQFIPVDGPVFQIILVDEPEEFGCMQFETPEGILLYVNKRHTTYFGQD